MRRPLRSLLILTCTLVVLSSFGFRISDFGFGAEGEEERARAFAKLERGMTPQQVRERVGAPRRIARQILYHRYLEQWIYDLPHPARLQFDCPRGQTPQLIWKQVLAVEKGERPAGPRDRPD